MPGFWTPWPGKSSAIGPERSITGSPGHARLGPLQERGAPGQPGPETREQDVVAGLDATLPDRLLQRERDGCARGVAVLVDVHRDALHRQADPPRRGVDDAEVRLVGNPQVDLVEGDAGRGAHLARLADEDVDRELEHV